LTKSEKTLNNIDIKNNKRASLETIIIFTKQIGKLAEFYQKGLDLENPSFQKENHIGYQIGETYFGFDQVDEIKGSPPSSVTLWFTVDDLKSTLDRFIKHGANVHMNPTKKPWGATIASVVDIDGNIVGLEQRREK
jgi:predicted enzyme related to lactoylglutathione lyase